MKTGNSIPTRRIVRHLQSAERRKENAGFSEDEILKEMAAFPLQVSSRRGLGSSEKTYFHHLLQQTSVKEKKAFPLGKKTFEEISNDAKDQILGLKNQSNVISALFEDAAQLFSRPTKIGEFYIKPTEDNDILNTPNFLEKRKVRIQDLEDKVGKVGSMDEIKKFRLKLTHERASACSRLERILDAKINFSSALAKAREKKHGV
jgi:hypothetical protein